MIIPFATQSYQHRSLPVSAQRLVNAYAERQPENSKSQVAVLGSPGVTTYVTCGVGPIRGMHVMGGVLYVVSGGTLYSVTTALAVTAVGGVIGGTGAVQMADNGTQLCIVNGTTGYIYAVATGFVPITDANFHSANTVTFFDNVFVFDWAGTNKFFISNNLDGTTYNPLGFASAEVSSPNLLATVNQQENLLLFCQNRIEIWYDAGTANMPFLRVDGGVIERGCAAALSTVKEDNSVFFLGDDVVFYRLNNMSPQRISTHAIEAAWQKYATVADAISFSLTHEGHKFIVVYFPTANTTWKYDIATGLWHERISWDINGNSLGRWRGSCAVKFNGLNLIGDAFSGVIGSLDAAVFTEFGATMQAYMVAPYIHSDRKRVFISRFELDIETGSGPAIPAAGGSVPITSGTYNSTTGLVTLTLATGGLNLAPGSGLLVSGVTGTGTFTAIQGEFICGPGTAGNTVVYTTFTGLTLTISGGTVNALADPQVMLQWSKDGGRTFSSLQTWQSMGKLGAYAQRLRWLRLGQARQWCFAVTIADPVRRTVIAANADITGGM